LTAIIAILIVLLRRHRFSLPCLPGRRHQIPVPIPERAFAAYGGCRRENAFYFVTIASILLVLSLSANTALRISRAFAGWSR